MRVLAQRIKRGTRLRANFQAATFYPLCVGNCSAFCAKVETALNQNARLFNYLERAAGRPWRAIKAARSEKAVSRPRDVALSRAAGL